MKKLIALLLSVVMLLSLAACGEEEKFEEDDEKGGTVQKEERPSEDDTEGTEDTEATEGAGAEELKFWYAEKDWQNLPEGVFDGKVLDGALTLPVDIEELDTLCAPYTSGYGDEAITVSSLQELVTSEELTEGITLRMQEDHPLRRKISNISIYALDQDEDGAIPTSYAQCFQNGWWNIYFQEAGIVQEEGPSWEDRAEGDRILERFGRPTDIMIDADDTLFHDSLGSGDGMLFYYLVYEFDEYAMVFQLSDLVSSYYEVATMEINSIVYYPKPMWELKEAELVSVWGE